MNEAALKDIADASGGAYLRLAESQDIFERLRADTTRRSKTSPRPIKSRNWLPMVLLGTSWWWLSMLLGIGAMVTFLLVFGRPT